MAKPAWCEWHDPKGLGYLCWFQWANENTSKGHEQKQCHDCKHWFFPDEFGNKPAESGEGG
jgi:hypothetical protein